MTDVAIIDAYERAYDIAQAVGADHREPAMPSQRDRQTMTRRVRGYVLSGNRGGGASSFSGSTGGVGMRERKALARMGRKGGQKAAERWKDRDSEYAQAEISKLSKANKKRSAQGRSVSYRIAAYFDDAYFQTETYPTVQEAAAEFGVSNRTVQRALAKAGIQLPTGRRKKGDRP